MAERILTKEQIESYIRALLPSPDLLTDELRIRLRKNLNKTLTSFANLNLTEDDFLNLRPTLLTKLSEGFNKPRILKPEERKELLELAIPKINSSYQLTGKFSRQKIINKLDIHLSKLPITPDGIQILINEIRRYFIRAQIDVGTPVGMYAAESLTEPLTQLTLNSHRTAGFGKSIGVDRFKELVYVNSPEIPSIRMFFNDENMTYDKILSDVQRKIININVQSIIREHQTRPASDLADSSWWYQFREQSGLPPLPETKVVLRLYLNLDLMYQYQIDIENIKSKFDPEMVLLVFSPIYEGILDIYPLERKLQESIEKVIGPVKIESEKTKTEIRENLSEYAIQNVIIPNLESMNLSGILSLTEIYPARIQILTLVRQWDLLDSGNWLLTLDEVQSPHFAIDSHRLNRLITFLGYNTHIINSYQLEILGLDIQSKPATYLQELVSNQTDIEHLTEVAYLDTKGGDFLTILAYPLSDPYHCLSDKVIDNLVILGVEATRSYMISEFYEFFKVTGSAVNIRHILLVVDDMLHGGNIRPFKEIGVKERRLDTYARAVFKSPYDVFRDAAVSGVISDFESVTASILTGQRAPIGTGIFDLDISDSALNNQADLDMEAQEILNLPISNQDLDDILDPFDISFGRAPPTQEIDLDDISQATDIIPQRTDVAQIPTVINRDVYFTQPLTESLYRPGRLSNLAQEAAQNIATIPVLPTLDLNLDLGETRDTIPGSSEPVGGSEELPNLITETQLPSLEDLDF